MFGIHYKKDIKKKGSRGFLMMYAVLFITVVLGISFEILGISLKQLIISSSGEESARAFYAADAGTECAYYLDFYEGYFSTSTPDGSPRDPSGTTYSGICDTNNITIIPPADPYASPLVWEMNPSNPRGISFQVRFDSGKDMVCADVYITKNLYTSGPSVNSVKNTIIRSYGYNTDCPGYTPQRLPVVERRIITSY